MYSLDSNSFVIKRRDARAPSHQAHEYIGTTPQPCLHFSCRSCLNTCRNTWRKTARCSHDSADQVGVSSTKTRQLILFVSELFSGFFSINLQQKNNFSCCSGCRSAVTSHWSALYDCHRETKQATCCSFKMIIDVKSLTLSQPCC